MVRKRNIELIYQLVGFPDLHWKSLCLPILDKCDGDLDDIRRVLLIRQGYLLPFGSVAEEIYRKRDLWTYLLFVCACIRSGASIDDLPGAGRIWILDDQETARDFSLFRAWPSTGIIKGILDKVYDGDVVLGEHPIASVFRKIVQDAAREEAVSINERGALLHRVDGGLLLVSPKIFKHFFPDHWESMIIAVAEEYGAEHVRYNVEGSSGVFVEGLLVKEGTFDVFPDVGINDTLIRSEQ